MRLWTSALVVALALGNCPIGVAQTTAVSLLPPTPRMTVVVGSSATHQLLRDVRVLLVGSEKGPEVLGQTNEFGRLDVDKATLRKQPRGAVLFCLEGFFCGAFRIDDLDLANYDEKLIHLAPIALQ